MNKLLSGLKEESNFVLTENGATTLKSTENNLFDLFAMGAAYRSRTPGACILLFKKAYEENPCYALKCLFYLRDILEGQGERRFFRTIIEYIANSDSEVGKRIMQYIPEYGRWDDFYAYVDTSLEEEAFRFLFLQFSLDLQCKTPSLLGKWLKSENATSAVTRILGKKTRKAFGLTAKEYRKDLSALRKKINVVERLMSAREWDKIEFDKIPSKAGMIYRNAFARHDVEREKKNVRSYKDFIQDKTTTVNAKALFPYEVVEKAVKFTNPWLYGKGTSVEREAINKYWENLTDYFNGASLDALCMIDTSGSMWSGWPCAPIDVAISLGLYAAERARGPFQNHYISFSSRPQLIETDGYDFVDKVERIYKTNLCENTDIEAAFDMLLNTAIENHCAQEDLPKTIIVVSDMQFDVGNFAGTVRGHRATLMENIAKKWEDNGYTMPNLVYWCVAARDDNVIPMHSKNGITFCSGFSPVLFEQILKEVSGYDLMMDKLNSERYSIIE